MPTAHADLDNVTEGVTQNVSAADGVLANDTSADGWHHAGAIVGVAAGDTGAISARQRWARPSTACTAS